MGQTGTTPFQEAMDHIERLPAADQAALIQIVRQRLIEQRRAEIAANAKETLERLQQDQVQVGSFGDLRRDLLDQP